MMLEFFVGAGFILVSGVLGFFSGRGYERLVSSLPECDCDYDDEPADNSVGCPCNGECGDD